MLRSLFFACVSLVVALISSGVRAQSDSVAGLWATSEKDGVIEIFPCEDQSYCGRFYWLQGDSAETPSFDDHNPDPDKKKIPLCGMTFMGGFLPEGEGKYTGGWIYSIRHGATFSAELTMQDADTLELRGYVFLPFLGGTETWTRIENVDPCYALTL